MVYLQGKSFLIFFLIGVIIGCIIDFFRAIRKSFITTDFHTLIQDIICIILIGIILTFSIIIINQGEIRSYILLGIVTGLGSYFLTISKPYVIILKGFVDFIQNITKILFFSFKKIIISIMSLFNSKY